MNRITRLLIENENNQENLKAIHSLAKEVVEMLLENNDYLESAAYDEQTGKVFYEFTQQARDIEAEQNLWYEAEEYFHEHFNSRSRTEIVF